jgi:alpha-L-fucosidase
MAVVAEWMKVNAVAITQAKPLPDGERASVPATAAGTTRYLFALPKFQGTSVYEKDRLPAVDETLTLRGGPRPSSVRLLRDGTPLKYTYADGLLAVQLPASARTALVDVVQVN